MDNPNTRLAVTYALDVVAMTAKCRRLDRAGVAPWAVTEAADRLEVLIDLFEEAVQAAGLERPGRRLRGRVLAAQDQLSACCAAAVK